MTTQRLAAWVAETREELRLAREDRERRPDADRAEREQRRHRAAELAARREVSPIPTGRSHADVLNDYLAWSDWVDAADTGTTP